MNHVIRRSSLILVALAGLLLSACGSDSEVWLERGDLVVTKADVLDFAQMQSGSDTSFPRLNADAVRALLQDVIRGDGAVDYLGAQGITPTEDDLAPFMDRMVASGMTDTDSTVLQAFARREWAFSPELGLLEPQLDANGEPILDAAGNVQFRLSASGEAARETIGDVVLSSRVGVWDPVEAEVLPPVFGD